MIRRPPRSTRTDTLFPTRRSSDLEGDLRPRPGDADGTLPEGLLPAAVRQARSHPPRGSEEHTSELQSLMRNSYAVFCLKKKKQKPSQRHINEIDYQIKRTINYIGHKITTSR